MSFTHELNGLLIQSGIPANAITTTTPLNLSVDELPPSNSHALPYPAVEALRLTDNVFGQARWIHWPLFVACASKEAYITHLHSAVDWSALQKLLSTIPLIDQPAQVQHSGTTAMSSGEDVALQSSYAAHNGFSPSTPCRDAPTPTHDEENGNDIIFTKPRSTKRAQHKANARNNRQSTQHVAKEATKPKCASTTKRKLFANDITHLGPDQRIVYDSEPEVRCARVRAPKRRVRLIDVTEPDFERVVEDSD